MIFCLFSSYPCLVAIFFIIIIFFEGLYLKKNLLGFCLCTIVCSVGIEKLLKASPGFIKKNLFQLPYLKDFNCNFLNTFANLPSFLILNDDIYTKHNCFNFGKD